MKMVLRICLFASIFFAHNTVFAQENLPATLTNITQSDPFSCSRIDADYTQTSACLGDVGAFQTARLSLAVESIASALFAAGFRESSTEIQKAIFSDITKFGVEEALSSPAMALADVASLNGSPFSKRSDEILGKSIIALEYLYPGTVSAAGFSYKGVASMARMQEMKGPRNFTSYMHRLASTPIRLSDFRVFAHPQGFQATLQKSTPKSRDIAAGQGPNHLGQFSFSSPISLNNTRGMPLGMMVAETASIAQNSGVPLDGKLFPNLGRDGGRKVITDAPFGGATCRFCSARPNKANAANSNRSLFEGGMSFQTFAALPRVGSSLKGNVTNGASLMKAERQGQSNKNTKGENKKLKPRKLTPEQKVFKKAWNENVRDKCNACMEEARQEVFSELSTAGEGRKLPTNEQERKANKMFFEGLGSKKIKKKKKECNNYCNKLTEEYRKKYNKEVKKKEKQKEKNKKNGAEGATEAPAKAKKEASNGKTRPNTELTRKEVAPDRESGNKDRGIQKRPGTGCANTRSLKCGCNVNGNGELNRCALLDQRQSLVAPNSWFFANAGKSKPREIYFSRLTNEKLEEVRFTNYRAQTIPKTATPKKRLSKREYLKMRRDSAPIIKRPNDAARPTESIIRKRVHTSDRLRGPNIKAGPPVMTPGKQDLRQPMCGPLMGPGCPPRPHPRPLPEIRPNELRGP